MNLPKIYRIMGFLEDQDPQFQFSWCKQPADKVWKKIYREFYFDGITLTLLQPKIMASKAYFQMLA